MKTTAIIILFILSATLLKSTLDAQKERVNNRKIIKEQQLIIRNDSLIFVDLLIHPVTSNKEIIDLIIGLNRNKFEFHELINDK